MIYYSRTFDDKVRTFCMNPYGEVVLENLDGLVTVNGHSYTSQKTENSNFAILVSSTFTDPFDDPISYGQYIARLANLLGQGALIQRLGDWTEDEETKNIARNAYFGSIGGWKKSLEDDSILHAFYDFRDLRTKQMAEEFLRKQGISPHWI